jgi:hypothetical protein
MNEIREWLSEHGYALISELITTEGAWLLHVQFGGVTVPVTLIAREVETPQRGIAAIESLFAVIRPAQNEET